MIEWVIPVFLLCEEACTGRSLCWVVGSGGGRGSSSSRGGGVHVEKHESAGPCGLGVIHVRRSTQEYDYVCITWTHVFTVVVVYMYR